jgi:hypothetical protein
MLVLRTIDQLQVQVTTEAALAHRVEVARVHQTIVARAEVALARQTSALLAEVQARQTSVLLAEVQEEASVVPLEVAPQEDPDQEGEINSPFFLETVFPFHFILDKFV